MIARADGGGRAQLLLALAGLALVLLPLAGRTWSTDIWGETRHLQSAEAFARDGFVTHRFTPYTQITPPGETPPGFRVYYTRTQQLSFAWFGWLHGLGLESRLVWRLFAIAMTMAGVAAFYAMLRAGDVPAAAAGWASVALAGLPALGYWGTTWALVYCSMPLLTFGAIAMWLRRRRRESSARLVAGLWLTLFLQGLATQHTYLITTQMFFWIYALLERRWSWRDASLWLSPHVAALALIVSKNAWLLGGLGPALFDDILPKVLWRMANITSGAAASSSYPFSWDHLLDMVWKQFRWSGGLLALILWVVVLIARAPTHGRGPDSPVRRLTVALLVPGIVYGFVFFQEVYVHYFHSRNLMAGFCLMAGFAAWRLLGDYPAPRRLPAVAVCMLALLAQYPYTHRQASESPEWIADVTRLGAVIEPESDLVISCDRDDYPVHYLLGKPFVFPRSPEQKVSTHPWWQYRDWEDLRPTREAVEVLWPGRRVGFAVRRRPENDTLRRALLDHIGPPRFSGESYDIFVTDEPRSVDVAEPAETIE